MFKNIYHYIIALIVITTAYSCQKDIGNYDYNSINKVEFGAINTENPNSNTIKALFAQRLVVKPELTFTEDAVGAEADYSYEWAYVKPNDVGAKEIKVFATTKNLDLVLPIAPGTYKAYYGVTDNKTGVKFRKEFSLEVVNEINEGWLLMTDVNGNARVDMIAKGLTDEFSVVKDLLASTGSGLQLNGKPVMIYSYDTGPFSGPGINLPYAIYVGTDKSTDRLSPETFKWLSAYNIKNEIFGNPVPADFHADLVKKAGFWRSYMISNGDAYLYDRNNMARFSVPINYIDAEKKPFKIAPFIGNDEAADFALEPAIFYDVTNKRFIRHSGVGSCTLIPDPANKLFSFTTGKDLIYMEKVPFNGGEVFSILKDPGTLKQYLARFSAANNIQSYYDEIVATDFDKAQHITVSPDLGYIFYSVDGKLYEYDMSLKTTKLMFDKGAQKISLIKFEAYHNYIKYTTRSKLIVCSYDPSLAEGVNGKMERFTVPTGNGNLVLFDSYSGFGKVVSLHYRER
ncbi:hypothetical protein C3K47_04160 [Solitalea longa]|uniref:PKD-like family protein n=1 Tax=Solitalea longa TaxID=2079460 RepID=A0A2S5A7U2_9SPHI|nr:PKD-like family lipoprotein [Solitalea longa]POY38596.1 hypothetical protein C3K47_04160 [Solitalea longa]